MVSLRKACASALRKVSVSDMANNKRSTDVVLAPIAGAVIELANVPDPVFSSGVMGGGCGIEPDEESVVAPFSGTVTAVTPTEHAIGITSDDGVEVLIHVGIDTVDMNGDGFCTLVEEGQKVEEGEPILAFARSLVRNAGHSDVVVVLMPPTSKKAAAKVTEKPNVKTGDVLISLA